MLFSFQFHIFLRLLEDGNLIAAFFEIFELKIQTNGN